MPIDLRKLRGQLGTRVEPTDEQGLDLSGVPANVPATYCDIKFRNGVRLKDNGDGNLVIVDTEGNEHLVETGDLPNAPTVAGKYNLVVDAEGALTWELDADGNMPDLPEDAGAYVLVIPAEGDPSWGDALPFNAEASPVLLAGLGTDNESLVPTALPGDAVGLAGALASHVVDSNLHVTRVIEGRLPLATAGTEMLNATLTGGQNTETVDNAAGDFLYPAPVAKLTVEADAAWGTDGAGLDYFRITCLDCDGNPFTIDVKGLFSGVGGGIAGVAITRGGVKVGISKISSVSIKMAGAGVVPAADVDVVSSDEVADAALAALVPFLDGADALERAEVESVLVTNAEPPVTGTIGYTSVIDVGGVDIVDAESGLLSFDLAGANTLQTAGLVTRFIVRTAPPTKLNTAPDPAEA